MDDPISPDTYVNRELSWLDFNKRVFSLTGREDFPLLEKAKFLAIWSSNLDEFFQVRVAGLKEQVAHGIRSVTPDGLTPGQALSEIRADVDAQYQEVSKRFLSEVAPALAKEGIVFSDYSTIDDDDREFLDRQFAELVFPVVTPLAVDPAHPFPYISNLSLNLAIFVRNPETTLTRFARVKIPPILPRFVVLPDGERFIPLEQVIAAHLDALFPGMEVLGHHVFRVTRNADFEVEEDEGGDLLMTIESELTQRRFGRVVRLEVHPDMPDDVLDLLMREMGATEDDVYRVDGPLDLSGLWSLYDLDRPELKFPVFTGVTPNRLAAIPPETLDFFEVIRQGDLLAHHPYDSFASTVEAFITRATRDADVLAIKITLYRTDSDSQIMQSLIDAAEQGKQVVALVELKARFDEERNIEWAQRLEDVGVHVMYGVVGLKTHTKVALVMRREGDRVVRYAHIGTGNYNESTARIYEDVGVFTCDEDLGSDLSDLFNYLTGYSRQTRYRSLAVSPGGIRSEIMRLIEDEAARPDGQITMKMNSLVDAGVVEALYRASQAGTRIDLCVRGICCLVPGLKGVSETIRVRSIVGRYLEHSRVYRFGARGRERRYLYGSADMMPRNLDRRVEALAPVTDRDLQFRLDEILDVVFADDTLAWEMTPHRTWERVHGDAGIDSHVALQDLAIARSNAHL
ncbi:MAG TPA: polyphosphate kinase 1 [Acidimicrobiia bacterium]|jgi:polyphosphate kinase|nr:polyphosphate kinase 1 [Acidimicrobiia bacterium]